jgi:hypothetical protein
MLRKQLTNRAQPVRVFEQEAHGIVPVFDHQNTNQKIEVWF